MSEIILKIEKPHPSKTTLTKFIRERDRGIFNINSELKRVDNKISEFLESKTSLILLDIKYGSEENPVYVKLNKNSTNNIRHSMDSFNCDPAKGIILKKISLFRKEYYYNFELSYSYVLRFIFQKNLLGRIPSLDFEFLRFYFDYRTLSLKEKERTLNPTIKDLGELSVSFFDEEYYIKTKEALEKEFDFLFKNKRIKSLV